MKVKTNYGLGLGLGLRSGEAILGAVLLAIATQTACEGQSASTNKTFMLNNGTGGTVDNGLPPSVSNFFAINSNLLNQSVREGGSGGGGTSMFSPQFSYNGGNGTNIVAGVTVTNLSNVGNLFNSSNNYVAKTNFANVVAVTNRVTFPAFGEQIGDDGSGNLSIFNPFGDVNIGGSSFGAIDGTLNANLVNAAIPVTDLNNGTGATSRTYWNGAGIWKYPFPTDSPGVLTNDGSGNLSWVAVAGGGGGAVSSVGLTGDGTVFNSSVTGSPVTGSGTLAPSLHTQSANNFFAGPTSGSAAAPTFRGLSINDFNGGSSASSSTYWRGDGSWATPSGGGGSISSLGVQFQSSPSPGSVTNIVDGMTNFGVQFPYHAGQSPIAVIDGDSISDGNGSSSEGHIGVSNYFMFLTNSQYYGLQFAKVANDAVDNQTAQQILANYNGSIHTNAPGAGTNAFLSLMAGINDIVTNGTAEVIYGSLTNIWGKAHADNFKVVAFTVTSFLTNTESQAMETWRLNQMIRNSSSNWDYLVDAAAIIPPPFNTNWYVWPEGSTPQIIHPTNYAQQFLALNMSNVLCRPPHIQTTQKTPFYMGAVPYGWVNQAQLGAYSNTVTTTLSHYLATNTQQFTQSAAGFGNNEFFTVQNTGTGNSQMTWISVTDSDTGGVITGEYLGMYQPSVNWTASSYWHVHTGQIQVGPDDTGGLDFLNVGGGHWNFYDSGPLTTPVFSITAKSASTTNIVIATNGFSSLNTNILTAATATSWSGQMSTINSGFTNNYGTNCTININGSAGYFVFYHSGGAAASTACANPLFTNALSTNGWSRTLPFNCGVQVVASGGNANVTVDFGQ